MWWAHESHTVAHVSHTHVFVCLTLTAHISFTSSPSFSHLCVDALSSVASGPVLWRTSDVAKLVALPQHDDETWLVSVRRLPCWVFFSTAPDVAPLPVRPYCILVGCIEPSGARRLVARHADSSAADTAPNTQAVLDVLLRAMNAAQPAPIESRDEAPKTSAVPQHRPSRIVFTAADRAAAAASSLAAVGISVGALPEPEELARIAHSWAAGLAERRLAVVPPLALMPGLGRATGATELQLRAFYKLSGEVTRRQPWARISERQVLRIGNPVATSIWVGVIGNTSLHAAIAHARATAAATAAGAAPPKGPPPNVTRGICVFFSRRDAENRIMATALKTSSAGAPQIALPHPYDSACALPSCRATPKPQKEFARCGSCRDAHYCELDHQRADWPRHKMECSSKPEPASGAPADGPRWAARECIVHFEQGPGAPLEDHDALDAMGLALPSESPDVPVALTFTRGTPGRPTLTELAVMCRGMAAVLAAMDQYSAEVLQVYPRMQDTAPLDLSRRINAKDGHWYDAFADACDAAVAATAETSATILTDAMVTADEAARLAVRDSLADPVATDVASTGVPSSGGTHDSVIDDMISEKMLRRFVAVGHTGSPSNSCLIA